jgi:hypothetical protein
MKKHTAINHGAKLKLITARIPKTQWDLYVKMLSHRTVFPLNASDSLKVSYALGISISCIHDQLEEMKVKK